MNEIILVATFVAILFGTKILLSRINKPLIIYIRLTNVILLLLLAWVFGTESEISIKLMFTAVALSQVPALYKEIRSISSFSQKSK